jgi:hypothetical protein
MCLNGSYSKVRIVKHLSAEVSIQNGLKQGDVLSPLLLKFDLEYAVRKAVENKEGLELTETHQLLVYTCYFTLLGENLNIIKRNIEAVWKLVQK